MPQERVGENLIEAKVEKPIINVEQKEIAPEKKAEKIEFVNDKKQGDVQMPIQQDKNDIVKSSHAKDFYKQRAKAIDAILSEGLDDVFIGLNPKEQKRFKKAGEETVQEINTLLSQTKVKVNKIIKLIKNWLKIIPGVNKFFIEQESKIKTDKIIRAKNKF